MNQQVFWIPPWGERLVVAVALVLAAVFVLQAWRERRGVSWRRRAGPLALRLAVLGALVAVLLNPMTMAVREESARPTLIVLVDTSSSMAVADVGVGTRWDAASSVWNDPATRQRWEKEFTLDMRRFDRHSEAVDGDGLASLRPGGDGSDLAGALTRAVNDLALVKSQAGVLVVSDGRSTTEGVIEAARLAVAQSVPVWTYCVGGLVTRRDVWVEATASELLTFAGAEVELAATVRQTGFEGRSVKVELLAGDGNVLETREVAPVGPGGAAVARFRLRAPSDGEHRYRFRVAALEDEVDAENNERSVYVRVVGRKVRVLVAEGQPHWDTKFLVQSLKRSPHVDVTAVYRLGPGRSFAVVSSAGNEQRVEQDLFPRTREAWDGFDVVILGRGCEVFIDDNIEKLLTAFVSERGGSVVFSRGKPYGGRFPPLARLEPVVWSQGTTRQVRMALTEAGEETPIFTMTADETGSVESLLGRLPMLDEVAVTGGEKPLAVVLAKARRPEGVGSGAGDETSGADGAVLMAYQRFGQGKVLTLNATGMWRWAFGESDRGGTDALYANFWLGVMRWLLAGTDFLPGTDVTLRSARRVYTSEQPMQVLVATKGLDVEAYRPRVTIAGGETSVEIEPRFRPGAGGYVAEAGPFPSGSYTVTLHNNIGQPATMEQTVEVVHMSRETRELSADPETMAWVSEISGGRVLGAGEVRGLDDVVRRWQAAQELGDERTTLWDRWWLMALMIGLLGVEWYWRRQEGLL